MVCGKNVLCTIECVSGKICYMRVECEVSVKLECLCGVAVIGDSGGV